MTGTRDHARAAAGHLPASEIDRAGAHAREAHLSDIRRRLDEVAILHASRSGAEP